MNLSETYHELLNDRDILKKYIKLLDVNDPSTWPPANKIVVFIGVDCPQRYIFHDVEVDLGLQAAISTIDDIIDCRLGIDGDPAVYVNKELFFKSTARLIGWREATAKETQQYENEIR